MNAITLKRALRVLVMILMLALVATVTTAIVADAHDVTPETYSVAFEAEAEGEEAETAAEEDDSIGGKALAAGLAIGLAAAAGAIGMGIAIAKSAEGISRQPEADGKIRTNLMVGLVFIETAIIYALIVSILIIFVL